MMSSLQVGKENERSGDRETQVDGTVFMSQRRPCAKAIGGSLQEEKEFTNCHRVENFMWRVVGNENGKMEGWVR